MAEALRSAPASTAAWKSTMSSTPQLSQWLCIERIWLTGSRTMAMIRAPGANAAISDAARSERRYQVDPSPTARASPAPANRAR